MTITESNKTREPLSNVHRLTHASCDPVSMPSRPWPAPAPCPPSRESRYKWSCQCGAAESGPGYWPELGDAWARHTYGDMLATVHAYYAECSIADVQRRADQEDGASRYEHGPNVSSRDSDS